MKKANYNWNATTFFKDLTQKNKLAKEYEFRFCSVSGLQGFEEALAAMMSTTAFVCVADEADGYMTLGNTPHTRRVKSVFFAMRHAVDDMDERRKAYDVLRELFRQFMTKLLLEKVRIEQNHIYLDERITFTEIEKYFFSGCACAYFQIAVDVYTDLRIDNSEWDD